MISNRLTSYILIGLVLGLFTGYAINEYADPVAHQEIAGNFDVVTKIFLRLIKMIIAPLILSTLVVGIAKMGDGKSVGRVGLKTLGWFLFASLVSLTLGLIMVNLFRPGDALQLATQQLSGDSGVATGALSVAAFIEHAVPASIVDGMARNEILQILVFSIFFGLAAAAIGEKAKPLVDAMDSLAHIMLKVTGYVMQFAPLAVFAAVTATIAKSGLGVLSTFGIFMAEFYFSIVLLWILLMALGFVFLRARVFDLIKSVREPILLAFSTASSEAAYPKTLEQLEKFGVNNRIASFVLPLGYSFNLDGSMMYCTFATLFIAQAYGIEFSLAEQITMLLVLMVTSKGIAGVPRASLVVIAATLVQFNIPEAGLLLLLGFDHFLDMARSATNVVGNSVASAVVAKWEGQLGRPQQD
jgi:Na+/H+-dicarboxylate symporter